MGKKTVFWYGVTEKISWAKRHLATVTIHPIHDFHEVLGAANNLEKQVILIVDLPGMNQERVMQFLRVFEFYPNLKMIFFFENNEVPQLNMIKNLNPNRINFIHRYDLFALRGCVMGLLNSSTMFLRSEKRISKYGTIQIKRYMESKWRKVNMSDVSVHGVGIQS